MKKPIEFSDSQQGWVKLPRNLLASPIIKNPTLIQTYTWSFLKANHQPKWFSIKLGRGSKEVYCDVGQFITGRNRAADELGMPGSTWYTNITKLKAYGYLKIESNSHYSLITVVNYGDTAPDAQPLEQQKKKAKTNKLATKEQPTNTNNNYKNEKNKKKENNNKKEYLKNSNSFDFQNLNDEKEIEEDSQGTKQTYEFVVQMISEELPRVKSIPQQLSFEDFKLILNHYDINDIVKKFRDLDNWKDIKEQKSVASILNIFLQNDKDILPLLWEKQHVLIDEPFLIDRKEVKAYLKKVEDLDIWKTTKHGVDYESKKHFVKEYLKWIKTFEKYPRINLLKAFTIEEAIELERQYVEFWGCEIYLADLYYSSYLKKHTSMFNFLKEYFERMYEE